MLRERLGTMLLGLPAQHHRSVVRLVLLYALGRRSSRDLQDAGRQWGCTEQLFRFKSEFLDRSHYMLSVFWRACFLYFRHVTDGPDGPSDTAIEKPALQQALRALPISRKMAQECEADVALIETFFTVEEHRALRRIGMAAHFETPSEHDLKPLIEQLHRYCHNLARQKLWFLVNNDPGHSLDDFVTELFEAGLSTMRHYDADADQPLKLLNFARRGAKNHCMRLIDYHTAQRRARLVRNSAPPDRPAACGTCAWFDCRVDGRSCADEGARPSNAACPRGLTFTARTVTTEAVCGNCRHYTRPLEGAQRSCLEQNISPQDQPCPSFAPITDTQEFSQTTGSLDRTLGDEPGARRVDETIGAMDEPNTEWLRGLAREVPPHVLRVVRITLGQADEEFEQWLRTKTQRSCDAMTDRQIARYACEFCGVTLKQLQRTLRGTSSLGRAA